ncbi:MAG: arsenate reductase [Bdellovibrio sp. CG12_big_fil_rev_8_21_14_0_65_39_13]|nr:MAG: arsenate reductase [Bdellovibrio sp. CG22_combo_CG10-13_8_21_14_all_39_27]PIQ61043.1 MAG: arsenate reductase [Bdellovibrio sp. CG12_big_fil_rev_8_21_14_0_65_39_13]PIR36810.1 MAG: arsenate reductase [Bdellovibrio sp. CG11_big_fil_rev_8_21_14_0_20_39_38]
MFTMYAIPNCDTVKKARTYLEKKKKDYEFVDFKKCQPTVEDIKRWAAAFGELPVNKKGLTYKKYKEEYEALSEAKKIKFIQEHASMIKRPILEKKGKVLAFGFEEEAYSKIK